MQEINTIIFEQSGAVGTVTAHKLKDLLLLYAEQHPDVLNRKESEEHDETTGSAV